MDPNIEVIVLSDDEDEDAVALDDSSVLIVEGNAGDCGDPPEATEVLDEEVSITYSRKAHVLPHARYDCTIPFCVNESNSAVPDGDNAAYCEQCFCYICNQLASACQFWNVPGFCHCNSHKRSVYWKTLRDKSIMGFLHELHFNFNPEDMDSDLQTAETSLQGFACSLAQKYAVFTAALEDPDRVRHYACTCCSHPDPTVTKRTFSDCRSCRAKYQKLLLYDYTPVMEHIRDFLDQSERESAKTCAIRLLGAAGLFITHSAPGTLHSFAVCPVVLELFKSTIARLASLLVTSDFPAAFTKHLQDFLQILPLQSNFRKAANSLKLRTWNDPLLSAVLKGQNVTGIRHVKGRGPEALSETAMVVRARVLTLQQQKKYRELARYLKVVKSDNNAELQIMREWIPLYLCKVGNYGDAVDALLSPAPVSQCLASRLSPFQFEAYLRILVTGHAPSEVAAPPQDKFRLQVWNSFEYHRDPLLSSTWTPIEGGSSLLKKVEVLKFALRVMNCNQAVAAHSDTWVNVLNFSKSSPAGPHLLEPDFAFLTRTRTVTAEILNDLAHTARVQVPTSFQNSYPDQALLLLATQALAGQIVRARLCPLLNIILTFKSNPWAASWLIGSLSAHPNVLYGLFCDILNEVRQQLYQHFLRKQDTEGQTFIASFLALFFIEPSVNLYVNTPSIHELLLNWNEFENPWQYHLRRLLEINGALLSPHKQRILREMVAMGTLKG